MKQLIQQAGAGYPGSRDEMFAAAHPELRKLSRSRLRDGGRNTYLETTALMHESYLRFLSTLSRLLDEAMDLPPAGIEAWLAALSDAHEPLLPMLAEPQAPRGHFLRRRFELPANTNRRRATSKRRWERVATPGWASIHGRR